jgi:ubiquinone/menaquinone biosynthesis C-methylase UbiE
MSFYDDFVVPRLTDLLMHNRLLLPCRKRVIGSAEGRVLEIGIGSGLNIPFYGSAVREIVGMEPSQQLISMARKIAEGATIPVTFVEESAEAIPLDDPTVDTVVSTWTMCTIPEVDRTLSDIRRVLKRGGRLLFAEHGLAPEASVRRWQNWLTPAWKRIGGGCHLNRPIREPIANAGFRFERLESAYIRGQKPFAFMYEGSAQPSR